MKLTLEPTGPDRDRYPTVTVSYPGDDIDINQLREMVSAVSLGAGFSPRHVAAMLGEGPAAGTDTDTEPTT